MATGAPGTNGVWQYGEDDSEATFSALLNKVASTADSSIGADRTRISDLETLPEAGLVPISPTSIVIATGSGSANALGQVSFTGATAVSLNGVFTSAYKNYRILMPVSAASTGIDLSFRLRNAGSDLSTGVYNRAGSYSYSAGLTNGYVASGTSLGLGAISNTSNAGLVTLDLAEPATTTRTTGYLATSGYLGATSIYSVAGGLMVNSAAAYDGFSIILSAGNITGSIQVFGYND